MPNERLNIDFVPDRRPQTPPWYHDVLWMIAVLAFLAAAIVVFIRTLPFLCAVLAVAAVLAGLSTWKAARRRRSLRRIGWPGAPVGAKTYFGFLAAWFIGLLAIVPLVFLGAAFAMGVLVIVGVAFIIAILTSLFRLD